MENHILAVKDILKVKFKFLKRLRNHAGYLLCNDRNRSYIRKQISEYIGWNKENFLDNFFNKYQLKLSRIELVDVDKPDIQFEIKYAEKLQQESTKSLLAKMRIYRSKEKSCISDSSFQSLINSGAEKCPSIRNCNYWKKILNSEFNIKTNSMGCYVSPKEKIEYYLRYFKDDIRIRNNLVNIRLAGDGTQVGSNLSVLNFTFGFLDKMKRQDSDEDELTSKLNPNNVTGNFSLGTFIIKREDYNELKIALTEVLDELKLLKKIVVDGIEYKIEFWLGGDLKFLALILGKNFKIF